MNLADGYKSWREHLASCDDCQQDEEAERERLSNQWMPETPIEWPTEADPRSLRQRIAQTLADIFSR